MKKHIGSLPEADKFRSIFTVILVLIFITLFFIYIGHLNEGIRQAAKKKTLNEINSALALTLYQLAIDSELDKLSQVENSNPFDFLVLYQTLPINYFGAVKHLQAEELKTTGWYFNINTKRVIYVGTPTGVETYRLAFDYEDKNNSGQFEYGADKIEGLSIKKAS